MTQPVVNESHIRWREPINIHFGFSGITSGEAIILAKNRLAVQFPELDRPNQCVYVVRLRGDVAVAYGEDKFSPVVYIGEGNASVRLKTHTEWFSELLVAIPNAAIEVRVADCVRQKDTNLCEYVEADLIEMFIQEYSCLPWFNKQRETTHKDRRTYSEDVLRTFRQRLGKGQGSKFRWAIRPIPNNSQYESYQTGWY